MDGHFLKLFIKGFFPFDMYAVYTDLTEISFETHVSCRISCAFLTEEY